MIPDLSTRERQAAHYREVRERLSPQLTVLVKRTPDKRYVRVPEPEVVISVEKVQRARDWLFVASRGVPDEFKRKTCLTKQTASSVIKAIANVHRMTEAEMLSSSRRLDVVAARQHLWHYLSVDMGFSYSAIARYFGKDHTTIRHGVLKYEARTNG